jgi:hypothetical protein
MGSPPNSRDEAGYKNHRTCIKTWKIKGINECSAAQSSNVNNYIDSIP